MTDICTSPLFTVMTDEPVEILVTARSGAIVSDQCVDDASTAADDVGGCEL